MVDVLERELQICHWNQINDDIAGGIIQIYPTSNDLKNAYAKCQDKNEAKLLIYNTVPMRMPGRRNWNQLIETEREAMEWLETMQPSGLFEAEKRDISIKIYEK